MKKIAALFFIGLIFLQVSMAEAALTFGTNTRTQPGYFKNLARNWGRGLTNLASFPLEIPMTIAKYNREDSSAPGMRHIAGFMDGFYRSGARAFSGAWDLLVSFIPGDQEGGPVKPATLFEAN